jgi:hypothetical protein
MVRSFEVDGFRRALGLGVMRHVTREKSPKMRNAGKAISSGEFAKIR